MKKRILSLLIALVMVVGLLPTVALAEEGKTHIRAATVSTEQALTVAIADATGTKDTPTVITVSQSIVLTESISFSNKFILIQGINSDITLSVDTESWTQNDSMFTVGKAEDSGTLDTPSSGLSLKNITIDMQEKGRAVFAKKSVIDLLAGCSIQNCTLTRDGGAAIYLSNDAKANMYSGATLKSNKSSGNGGAVCIWPNGIFNIYGGTIDGNSGNYGAAIWNSGGTIYMEGGTVSNNTGGDFGAIGSQNGSYCIIDSKNETDPVRMIGNINKSYRCGVFGNSGSTLSIKGALFENNQISTNQHTASAIFWGGPSNGNGSCTIENCTFKENKGRTFYFQGSVAFGANKTDETQSITMGKKVLELSKAIPEDSVLNLFYVNNGHLAVDTTIVQGTEDYTLTANDLERVRFNHDDRQKRALVLDAENNRFKTAVGAVITFNDNIGDDSVTATQTVPANIATPLIERPFFHDGLKFTGWNTQADGEGTRYENQASVTIGEDLSLYAQWEICDHVNKAYSADGAVLTETCADCGHAFGTASLEAPAELAYDGTAKEATVTTSEGWTEAVPEIAYYSGETVLDGAPINAGTYTAEITAGGATASLEFTISPRSGGNLPSGLLPPILSSLIPVMPGLPFTDVAESAWYYDAVEYVYDTGLMNGVGGSRFNPTGDVTRGMVATILYRMEGSPRVASDGAKWWSDARVWAMEAGVSDGTNMDGKITREQLAAMLFRYAKSIGADVSARGNLSRFSDAANVSGWAADAMQWAVGEGIIGGSNGKLNPKGLATRAEVAAMFMRFCKNIAK